MKLFTPFLLWLLTPLTVFAHATPVTYDPLASSVLEGPPTAITIRFSEHPEAKAGQIVVYDPQGKPVESGDTEVVPDDPYAMRIGVRASGTGTYTVSWQVVSADDGHFTKGAYAFSVGMSSASASAAGFQIEHRTPLEQVLWIAVELLGHALLLSLLLLVLRSRKRGVEAGSVMALRLASLLGTLCIVAGAAGYIIVQTWSLKTGKGFPADLGIALGTVAGWYAMVRLIVGFFAGLLTYAAARSVMRGKWEWRSVAAFLLLLFWAILRARVSHAAASHVWPAFSIAVNAVHILGKNLWIGSVLLFLFLCVPVLRQKRDARTAALASASLSWITSIAFGLGGVTGCYIVWLHLKSFGNLTATHWGMLFVALSAFAAVLLGARLFQQLFVDPALSGTAAGSPRPRDAARIGAAPIALVIEAVTGIAVLLLSSTILTTTPPLSTGGVFTETAQSQGVTITFGAHPYDDASMRVNFAGQGAAEGTPVVTLTNEEKNIGPLVVSLEKRADAQYVFSQSLLSPIGAWTADVTLQRPGTYDAVAHFSFAFPQSVTAARDASQGRTTLLTILSLFFALIIVNVSLWLAFRAFASQKQLANTSSSIALPPLPKFSVLATAGVAAMVFLFFFAEQLLARGHGAFQVACARSGHLWHESVPMIAGRVTSDAPVMGCMTGMGAGQYHFADAAEYAYFTRPVVAIAKMTSDPPKPKLDDHVTLTFAIHDDEGRPVTDLSLEHDRVLHAVLINQDLNTFLHLHSEDANPIDIEHLTGSTFQVHPGFLWPGRYLVAADFTVRAQTFSQVFYLNVTSPNPNPPPNPTDPSDPEYHIALTGTGALQAKVPQKISFHIEKDGKPVTDLEPYLAAPMHLAIASTDLRTFQHTHAELPQPLLDRLLTPRDPTLRHLHQFLPDHFGPDLIAYVTFPAPGTYVLFGQFKDGGRTVLTKKIVMVQ